jgi:hypothetical protein
MSEPVYVSPVQASVEAVRITGGPTVAVVTLSSFDGATEIEFVQPSPFKALESLIEDCSEIRVLDLNSEGANSLEFGRFRVELWDEKSTVDWFHCDSFKVRHRGAG